ncbi:MULTISPECIES: hypothetical protein [Acinetobacter]|uniref:hypothetical protein n=1 Tax=Acinetobacter TaxID=469 RepID=UPI000D002D0A|nr:hypothetical protein [Acinetobacter sp. MYb10]QLD61385.1 hypothetical protein CQZ96_008940 [Acinetobacter sp. MYb10]
MKKLILLGGIVGLVGCTAPSYNLKPTITELVSKPPIGDITTVGVGDSMLHQGNISEVDVLEVANPIKFSGYGVPSGIYTATGQDNKGKFFSPINKSLSMVSKAFYSDPIQVIMVSKENKLCVVSVFNMKTCTDDADFKVKKITQSNTDAFQQTLIYNGRIGNKINIGYREFFGDLARPAFTNSVEYDLAESKQIGYKGALLEIIDANNQSIKYKVLKNFNKAE